MFYIDNDSGVTVMPPVSAQRSAIVRWFSEGDGNNVITWPGMDWFNIVQAELLNTLEEAGIQPDKTKLNQLALSIKAIMNKNALLIKNNLSEIKTAGASAQRTARENLDIYDASLNKKGLVQLTSATDSPSETLAATAKAVKIAMDNANARLAKDRNGADIPNKPLFIQNLGLQETVKLASEALSTYGGVVNGDVIIKGILSLIGNELLIEKDNGFSGIHIRNKSTVAGSANGVDFSFGGAIMSSLICGIMENGANYIDVALSPAGNISDRRLLAFTLDGNIRQLIPRNGWSIQGYTKNSDFTQAMADAGWVRFPNGIIFQWCWGNTDASGWASAPFPVGWPVRCFGLLACNVAGDSIASAIAGVKRLNDRDMQVTLMERSGVAVSKPFFCIGVGC